MKLSTRIRMLRHHLGLTQAEFGEKLGVSNEIVSRLETANRDITTSTLYKICDTFKVSADWLLGLSDDSGFDYSDWYTPLRKRIRKKRKTTL